MLVLGLDTSSPAVSVALVDLEQDDAGQVRWGRSAVWQQVDARRHGELLATGIAAVLAVWAAYAFAGAGLIRPLPLLRLGLIAITVVYLARGLVLVFPAALRRPDLSPAFLFWSSLIVLAIGLVHAVGLVLAWPRLSGVR